MDFITVDFETPNRKNNSLCAMGITFVKHGEVVFSRMVLVNPNAPFSQMNVDLHGISEETVKNAPTFPAVWSEYERYFRHYPVVMHNCSFDTGVLAKDAKRWGINLPPMDVYCTMRLYQHNFPEYGHFSLDALSERFGVSLSHHQCDSDSLATAKLMLRLLDDENTCIFSSSAYCYVPKDNDETERPVKEQISAHRTAIFMQGGSGDTVTPSLDYSNEPIQFPYRVFAITGQIEGYSRKEITDRIQGKGGTVVSNVSRRVHFLVVGAEDREVVGADGKSRKIMEAERLISERHYIHIIEASRLLAALADENAPSC